MAVFVKQASQWSFGEQASATAVATTKNKWPGAQNGEFVPPYPESAIEEIRGGNASLDPLQQYPKEAKLEGSFDIVVQHAWWFYWLLGSNVDTGSGPYTHTTTGSNTPRWATIHEVLGADDGTQIGRDWIGCLPKKGAFGCDLNSHLHLKADFGALSFDDTVSAQAITAGTQSPYLWSQAEWWFYEPGTTNPLTHDGASSMTTPTALEKWDCDLSMENDEIRGHRNTNAHLPLLYTKGSRKHKLTLGLVPTADRTLFKALVANRRRFDFVYQFTRGTNDTIRFTWSDCYALAARHSQPKEDVAIRVDIPIQPRKVAVTTVDSYSSLLAAA